MLIVWAIFVVSSLLMVAAAALLIGFFRSRGEAKPQFEDWMTFFGFSLLVVTATFLSGWWIFFKPSESAKSIRDYTQIERQDALQNSSGRWMSDSPTDIVRTLVSNNVRGCGEFHYKINFRSTGEYLVYCTRDGRKWTAYVVWPNIDRVYGPADPDPSIAPPY